MVPTLAAPRPVRVVWIDHGDSAPRRSQLGTGRSSLSWKRLLAGMRDGGAEVIAITGRTTEAFDALGLTRPAAVHQAARHRIPAWRPAVRRWAREVRAHDPTGLGLAALLFGDLSRYELTERALRESRPSPIPDGRWTAARRTYELGQAALLQATSDPGLAYRLALRARHQATRPADARTGVLADLLLGRAAFLQQRCGLAASHFAAARDQTRPRSVEHVFAVSWLGRAHVWDGRPKLRLRSLRAAARGFRDHGELEGLLDALEAAGVAHVALMRLPDAESALGEANGLARSLGYIDRRFTTACNLAECRLLAPCAEDAERDVRSALRMVAADGHDEVADAWAVLAEAALARGRWQVAARAARQAIATTTSMNRRRLREHLCVLAEAQLLSSARRVAAQSLRQAASCADPETTALGSARLAVLQSVMGLDGVPDWEPSSS